MVYTTKDNNMSTPVVSLPAGEAAGPPKTTAGERLVSLDAFRGFTMFWLMGGKAFMMAIAGIGLGTVSVFLKYELTHSPWEGLRYYDLIWPSFMLMVGVSVPFSFTKGRNMRHVWKRAVVLFLLGSLRESMSTGSPRLIELSSALQPIAIAYVVASYLCVRSIRTQIAAAAGILAGYALLLAFVPAPGIPAGTYEPNHNLVTAVDQAVIGRYHPEGWGTALSTIPTISTTLIGLQLLSVSPFREDHEVLRAIVEPLKVLMTETCSRRDALLSLAKQRFAVILCETQVNWQDTLSYLAEALDPHAWLSPHTWTSGYGLRLST